MLSKKHSLVFCLPANVSVIHWKYFGE